MRLKRDLKIKYCEKCHNKRIKNKDGKYVKVLSYFVITKDDLIFEVYNNKIGTSIPYGTLKTYKYNNYKSNNIHLNKFLKEYVNYMKGKK